MCTQDSVHCTCTCCNDVYIHVLHICTCSPGELGYWPTLQVLSRYQVKWLTTIVSEIIQAPKNKPSRRYTTLSIEGDILHWIDSGKVVVDIFTNVSHRLNRMLVVSSHTDSVKSQTQCKCSKALLWVAMGQYIFSVYMYVHVPFRLSL